MDLNYYKEIKEKGIIKIKNFLEKEEFEEIEKIVRYYSVSKGHHKSYYSTRFSYLLLKILKFDFLKLWQDIKILNLAKRKKLNLIANSVFQTRSYLKFIDGYHSPISDKDVLPWHTDHAYHGDEKNYSEFVNPDHFHLKFFIYLTDVDSNNGCMSYIPESHKIGYAIRKGIFTKKLKFIPYFTLKEFRDFIMYENNIQYLESEIGDRNLINDFLKKTAFIEKQKESYDFDYKMSAGDAIIFNEGGVHKGSKSLKSERLVLRYLYSIKK